jgi:hypothetical protein
VRDEVAKAIAGVLVFAGRDRDRGVGGEPGVPFVIVRGDRFLEPVDVVLFDPLRELNGLLEAIGAVGIHHDLYLGPNRLANRLHPLGVLGERHRANLHFHRAGAQLDVVRHLLG